MLYQAPVRNLKFGSGLRLYGELKFMSDAGRMYYFSCAPLSGRLQPFFDVSRQHPAEVRNSIEVTQYLEVKIFLAGTERDDISFCSAARCARKIESGRNDCLTRDHPVFGIKRLVFLKIKNDGGDSVHHLCCGQMKSVFHVPFSVGRREC